MAGRRGASVVRKAARLLTGVAGGVLGVLGGAVAAMERRREAPPQAARTPILDEAVRHAEAVCRILDDAVNGYPRDG